MNEELLLFGGPLGGHTVTHDKFSPRGEGTS
jgi:hypothetical protein